MSCNWRDPLRKGLGLIEGRPVAALLANAGRGLGHAFLDQDWADVRHVVDTNVTGTLYLIQRIGRDMRARGQGRILIVGSIAGFMPGTYQAVYNDTKALLDSFSFALRAELDKGEGDVVAGWQNKLQAAIAHIMPAGMLADLHAKKAAPGTAPRG